MSCFCSNSNLSSRDALAGKNSQSTADFDECSLFLIELLELCWISVQNLFDIVFFNRFILELTFVSYTATILYQQWSIWRHKSNSRFYFELFVLSVSCLLGPNSIRKSVPAGKACARCVYKVYRSTRTGVWLCSIEGKHYFMLVKYTKHLYCNL